ncbi:MAG TPA: HDIG domain-containing protein, partial [Spirochaetia bacterium]|nr:HDIG domain-containing protein [Spirochaetia bacterium]
MKATLKNHPALEFLHPQRRLLAAIVVVSYLVITAIIVISNHIGSLSTRVDPSQYEVGQVADRDLISDRNLVYTDSQATKERADQAASEVPPVFQVDSSVKSSVLGTFNAFAELLTKLATAGDNPRVAYTAINAQFPGLFTQSDIRTILGSPNLLTTISIAENTLQDIMTQGIAGTQAKDFGKSPGSIKLVRTSGSTRSATVIPVKDVVTIATLPNVVAARLSSNGLDSASIATVVIIVSAFAKEDAFYDYAATQSNREKARQSVEPVVQRIAKGEKILKKGFVITAADMDKIQALGSSSKSVGSKGVVGTALLILALYVLGITLLGRRVIHKRIPEKYLYLLLGLAAFYVAATALLTHTSVVAEWLPYAVILPTALVAMIVTILIDARVGVMFSLLVSLTLFAVSSLTPFSFLFAFLSGVTSTFVVVGAERRIDLIRASIELAVANSLILVVFGFIMNYEFSWFLAAIGWGALNGFLCGILNLGLLPIFEHVMNAPTPFRLMELSDMNSPMLKRMLTLAPGTYGHSVSVANLAESACRAIGANALLARVGAYYHDIGKVDQSEYFIENQTAGNVHDDLKPSLSAAVIKSHVKIGIERAKELGLPKEVIDIIAQHHGSGLISYFYIQALKNEKETKVQPADFSYTGVPPTSREAAVVMLADTVEAASRTLKKPTVAKLERFIWSSII